MKNIDIFGSCVTRDAFTFSEKGKYQINEYFARSSIISLYSKPIPVSPTDIKLESSFQKRMVHNDLNKHFRRYVNIASSDFIIIDLIDERFQVIRTKDSYITRSNEFINSGIRINNRAVSEEEREQLWFLKIDHFINDLKQFYAPHKIILHKAFWKKEYKNKKGELISFQNPEINKMNNLLAKYYSRIETGLNDVNIIQLDRFVADENHQWGLSPFHYEDYYYMEFNKQLDLITNNRG